VSSRLIMGVVPPGTWPIPVLPKIGLGVFLLP
jgi:hypothetical protein